MNRFYVACDVGAEHGRVALGTLHRDNLTVSEVRRFPNVPLRHKDSIHTDIGGLYQEILQGLRAVGAYDEPADGVSCSSWAGDYVLFETDGSLMTACPQSGSKGEEAMKKVLAKVPWEEVYEQTGIPRQAENTLLKLAAQNSKRLRRAGHLLPMADGFNYLLAGVPRLEASLASATQLYDPVTKTWSERLLKALDLPSKLLPPVVEAGTMLGPLRVDIAKDTRLEEAQVVASCSHQLAAALAGLPINSQETWAYMRPGSSALMGTQLDAPLINDVCRELNFTNQLGYGGKVCFYRQMAAGLWIFEECQRYWQQQARELDEEMLSHLAGSATPFESLINPDDPRFRTPGDMPLKIQAFCKETNQPVPRKPGPIYRCILESLALHYRRLFREMEYLTSSRFARLYLLDGGGTGLLNHFIANALQVPVSLAPADAIAIGNVVVQALGLGHLKSLDEARQVLRNSFKLQTINPHAALWDMAADRFATLATEPLAG
jgi:rhamnulokinase